MCTSFPWDPELDMLRRQVQQARHEEEKRRLREELRRLGQLPYPAPCLPPPAYWRPRQPLSIHDVLGCVPR